VRVLLPASLIAILFLFSAGCKHKRKWPTLEPLGDDGVLASSIVVSDAHSAHQLVKGFYEPDDQWRWTARDFAATLAPPAHVGATGARLEIALAVPEALIQRLQSITLSTVINGLNVQPETYSRPGAYTYSRDIPPDRLRSAAILVEGHLDKTLPPSAADPRELGIIVVSIGFTAK